MWSFLAKVLESKKKEDFEIRLATVLLLGKLNASGVVAKVATPFVSGLLGLFKEFGILKIDLSLDALAEGKSLREFTEEASKAFDQATAKIYDEAEKERIRADYIRIIDKFASLK